MGTGESGLEFAGEGGGGHAAGGGVDFGALGVKEGNVRDAAHAEFLSGGLVGGIVDIEIGPDELGFVGGDFGTGVDFVLHLLAGWAPGRGEDEDEGFAFGFGEAEGGVVAGLESEGCAGGVGGGGGKSAIEGAEGLPDDESDEEQGDGVFHEGLLWDWDEIE